MQSKKRRGSPPLFTNEDWEKADELERLYIHLMNPEEFELSYEQEEHLESLRLVWGIMAKWMNNSRRVDKIIRHVDISKRQAYRYIEQASWLFGDVLKSNTETELLLLKNRYFALAERAEQVGLYDEARKCYDSAREVMNKLEALNPPESRDFAGVVFSSDPKLLTQKVEDVEFEEIPADLLELQAVGVPAGRSAD